MNDKQVDIFSAKSDRKLWGRPLPGLYDNKGNPNPKRMHRVITIAGLGGTGTSSLMRLLGDELGFRTFSTGNFFRQLAMEKYPKLSMDEARAQLEKDSETDPTIDLRVDRRVQQELFSHPDLVCDSRLATFSLAQIVNHPGEQVAVYLHCHEDVRHGRVAQRDGISHEEAKARNYAREASISGRYPKGYGITLEDILNPAYYNIVIDTEIYNEMLALQSVLNHLPKAWGFAHKRKEVEQPEGAVQVEA